MKDIQGSKSALANANSQNSKQEEQKETEGVFLFLPDVGNSDA